MGWNSNVAEILLIGFDKTLLSKSNVNNHDLLISIFMI